MGSFQGISDDFSAQLFVTINKNCETNSICGTYSVPSLPCSGNLILNGTDKTTFVFVEQKQEAQNGAALALVYKFFEYALVGIQ
jgi:hypothetical protein